MSIELHFPGRIITTGLNGFQEAYLYDRGWSPDRDPITPRIDRYRKAEIKLSWEPMIFDTYTRLDPPGLWTLTADCMYIELMLGLAEWYEALHMQVSTLPGRIISETDVRRYFAKNALTTL